MGTPAPYPNDPKITEEGKAMSSKLGSAGGTRPLWWIGRCGELNPDQDQNTGAV